eukprot:TRINITY_DN5806_c0_g1_i4.p1 TRINITY_DN5806_c0_g1~~TRINITY_DN5806_c0_g1_i4.p1  ORF type:complete len:586 (-),score=103.93 TRINITY_DN5806_c0_g1_i4:107-1864(-)
MCTENRDAAPVVDSTELLIFLQSVEERALSFFGSTNFDPKYYIDLPLRFPLSDTKAAFERNQNDISSFSDFLKHYFGEPGSDVVSYSPSDFEEEPEGFLPKVENQEVREWALQIHSLWKYLSRRVSDSVALRTNEHTLLPLPSNMVIPGSRFREVYYWDSYWIIRGLLASKMYDTAKNVLNNLMSFIERYGFVLNGARSYYTNRSQPPLLSCMVNAIYMKTKDGGLLRKALPYLLQEHKFWNSDIHKVVIMDVGGTKHVLSRYYAQWDKPRPECATIDKSTASGLTHKEKKLLYREIASGAESGWDFSSRWMRDKKDLKTLNTTSIVPVDLNVFLLQMEFNIAFFAMEIGNYSIAESFNKASVARQLAIDRVLWNNNMGQWLDYWLDPCNCEHIQIDSQNSQDVHIWNERNQNTDHFISNFFPLWIDAFHSDPARIEKVIHKFKSSGLLQEAGISTSLLNTGEQWDFPNGWAPAQHIIIEGISKHATKGSSQLAQDIAYRWLKTNLEAFKKTGKMHEKYDVTECGKIGGGGEYTPQTGFGWTNGVALILLETFGWPESKATDCSQRKDVGNVMKMEDMDAYVIIG